MADSYLKFCNLTKIFDDTKGNKLKAIDNINLNIQKSEFVTLLGPSGCGKTTILRIAAGFEKQTGGDVFFNDRIINDVASFNRNMPMVFQSYALFPHLTIFDNIAYGLRIKKKSKDVIGNDVAMACQTVNLVGLENRYPGELSGGQQQRVALARALVMKPEIILFDEPLSNLDSKLRMETRTEIKRVQQMLGITVLYVTHDQSEALSLSDKVVIMERGKIIQAGSPEEIYNNPRTPFVADFIGNSNFINAIVEDVDGKGITVRLQNRIVEVINDDNSLVFTEGEEIILSIKAEAVNLSIDKTDFTGIVDVSSFLGAYTEYKIDFEGSFLTVIESNLKGPAKKYKMGDPVNIKFNREFFHIYKK